MATQEKVVKKEDDELDEKTSSSAQGELHEQALRMVALAVLEEDSQENEKVPPSDLRSRVAHTRLSLCVGSIHSSPGLHTCL